MRVTLLARLYSVCFARKGAPVQAVDAVDGEDVCFTRKGAPMQAVDAVDGEDVCFTRKGAPVQAVGAVDGEDVCFTRKGAPVGRRMRKHGRIMTSRIMTIRGAFRYYFD